MAEAPVAPTQAAIFPAVAEMERLVAEQGRLTIESVDLNQELKDTLTTNDEMLVELNDKNDLLLLREAKLKDMVEKNSNELKQLELELSCTEDKYFYEVDIREKKMVVMQDKRHRYLKLKEENELLQQTFTEMNQELSNMEIQHTLTIHEMNKDMSVVRQNLELNLRRELVAMDQKYQQRAFSSLSAGFKSAIFENSKLKDEVTLQSIGLANLSLRLDKQKHDSQTGLADIRVLNRKAFALREALSVLASERQAASKTKDSHETQISDLEKKRDSLMQAVNAPPIYLTLQDDIERTKKSVTEEKLKILMWQQRLKSLHALDDSIIPTSKKEKSGIYSAQNFPFSSNSASPSLSRAATMMHASISRPNSSATENTHISESKKGEESEGEGVRIAELEAACEKDALLASGLRGIKGKESALTAGKADKNTPVEEQTQNMMSWIVGEILSIWKNTSDEASLKRSQMLESGQDFEVSASVLDFKTLPIDADNTNTDLADSSAFDDDLRREFSGGEYDPFASKNGGAEGDTRNGLLSVEEECEESFPTDAPAPATEDVLEVPPPVEVDIDETDGFEDPYLAYKRQEEEQVAKEAAQEGQQNEEGNEDMAFLQALASRAQERQESEEEFVMGQTGAELVESYRSVSSAVAGFDDEDVYNNPQHVEDSQAVEEFLLDELLANSTSKGDEDSAPWYRMREAPSQLPRDMKVEAADPNVNFFHDVIKPAPISFDVGPPVRSVMVPKGKGNKLSQSTSALPPNASMSLTLGGGSSLYKSSSTKKLARQQSAGADFVASNPRILQGSGGLKLVMPPRSNSSAELHRTKK